MLQENQTVLMEQWTDVETGMTNAGYDSTRIQEAQLLYVFSLYEYVEENDLFYLPNNTNLGLDAKGTPISGQLPFEIDWKRHLEMYRERNVTENE